MTHSSPEDRLIAVGNTLFPPQTENADGSHTLHDSDENLCAALYDLQRLNADRVCINTIRKVLVRLQEAKRLLGR